MTFVRVGGFHVRQLSRNAFFLQQAIAAPVGFLLLLFFSSWQAGTPLADDAWASASVAGSWVTTTTAVGIVGFQRYQGTLEHLALSTLRPGVVFGSLCAAAALLGLVGVPVALALQSVLGHPIESGAQTIIGLALSVVACVASACALASIFVLTRTATVYEPLLVTPVWLLTGIVVPLTLLPAWVMPIALLHPLTGAVQVLRAPSLDDAVPWGIASLLAVAVWGAVAARLLAAALHRARVLGTLALA